VRYTKLFVVISASIAATLFMRVEAAIDSGLSVLHPVERIAFSDDWRSVTRRTLRQGAHVFVILRLGGDSCADIESTASEVRYYVAYPSRLTTPSSVGSRSGVYYEALIPRNPISCSLSQFVLAEWRPQHPGKIVFRATGAEVGITVDFKGEFTAPRRPFLVGVTNSYGLIGHCGSYCALESELGHEYAALLARHHVQPIQNWVSFPPIRDGRLDLDDGGDEGRSFRDLVMRYSISGLIGFPRARYYDDPVSYLKALERTVVEEGLSGRAWVYVADEPRDLIALASELRLYRRFAPSVHTMVTTAYDPNLAHLVDVFAPVINWLGRANRPAVEAYSSHGLWVYASCMGSCGPSRSHKPDAPQEPGPDTGLPDFLIDRPAERLLSFFRELEEVGADAGFYYEATEGYRLVGNGVDLFEDPWNFGGNGDGLLLYPGRPGELGLKRHQPLPTMRLKLIRHAIETYW
jgi:hypothetical protein